MGSLNGLGNSEISHFGSMDADSDYKIFLNNALDDFMKSIGMVVVAYFLTISIANDIYRLLGKILISIVLFIALNRTYIVQEFFGIKQK